MSASLLDGLIDGFGRLHDSLRISVTDRCNIRCFYCMPDGAVTFEARENLLSFEEIERFVRIAASLGVSKIRLTGGEPLVRRDLPVLVRKLAQIPGIRDLALTTNAVLLSTHAESLYDAGLRRLNVHLDTLDREKFRHITRRDELPRVLEGLGVAKATGFKIKINVVAVKNLIEPDLVPMALFCRDQGFEPRFIEFMPLDSQHLWDRSKVLTADEIIRTLSQQVAPLEEVTNVDRRAPATEYRWADGKGGIGLIASVTRPFCLNCNRLRLTSDGKLRYCLFAVEETDVRDLLRGGSDAEIAAALRANVAGKWLGHEINSQHFVPPPRPMYSIGG
jgi:cyclic pyranopterin phosphate synthase